MVSKYLISRQKSHGLLTLLCFVETFSSNSYGNREVIVLQVPRTLGLNFYASLELHIEKRIHVVNMGGVLVSFLLLL